MSSKFAKLFMRAPIIWEPARRSFRKRSTLLNFPGVAFLRDVAELRCPVPVFAIGGIDRSNLEQVLAAGIGRVAVGQAIVAATSPDESARELKSLLLGSKHETS